MWWRANSKKTTERTCFHLRKHSWKISLLKQFLEHLKSVFFLIVWQFWNEFRAHSMPSRIFNRNWLNRVKAWIKFINHFPNGKSTIRAHYIANCRDVFAGYWSFSRSQIIIDWFVTILNLLNLRRLFDRFRPNNRPVGRGFRSWFPGFKTKNLLRFSIIFNHRELKTISLDKLSFSTESYDISRMKRAFIFMYAGKHIFSYSRLKSFH